MTICLKCHRPLKNPGINGLGPVCAKKVQPVPTVERDLFGFDIDAAATAAKTRLAEFIDDKARFEWFVIRHDFMDARKSLGVWS